MQRFLSVAIACVLVTASAAFAGDLKVITSGKGGLSDGDKVYLLGISASDFVSSFGPPERKWKGYLDYPSDGLRVLVDDAGTVYRFCVFFGDSTMTIAVNKDGTTTDIKVRAAKNASTDKGINIASTFREIVKAHGTPVKKDESRDGNTVWIDYAWGQVRMQDQRIDLVTVGADPPK